MILRSIAIHNGVFHADEITSCALLTHFNLIDSDKIFRTRDKKIQDECEYICDVGGIYDPDKKRFDHHQSEYKEHLSSAGMILLYLKEKKIISKQIYDYLNKELIWGVDQEDNGVVTAKEGVCTFSEVIANFLPIEYSVAKEEQQKAFFLAFDFTLGHLQRLLERYSYNLKSKEIVKQEMARSQKLLIFDQAFSWIENFFSLGGEKHPALFIIMPIGEHWKLRGIPPSYSEKMKVRVSLPEEWAGLHEEELKKKSNIQGAIFCHKGLFISIWETKEDALKAFNYVMGKK